MAAPAYTPISNKMDQAAKVEAILQRFQQKRLRRYNFEEQWQESALIFLPEWANTFFFGYNQWPGAKKNQYQIEAYPSIVAHRFMAITNSLMTPWTMNWSPIDVDDDYVMQQPGVSQYFTTVSKRLFAERYNPMSGFLGNQLVNWLSLGVFGNQSMFVEELVSHDGSTGLSYSAVPVGQAYFEANHQGVICGFFRTIRWNAAQMYEKWPDTFPEALRPALLQHSGNQFWTIQAVYPNDDYDPDAYLHPLKGKRYTSCYVSMEGHCILEEGGYHSFPMPSGRYIVAPDEDYGRGPGQIVLAGARSAQAIKASYLKQTHRKGDPILLGPDGGLVDASQFIPGDYVEGGMNAEGQMLIGVLPTGDINEIKDAMEHEQQMLDDGFLTSLFQLALKTAEQPTLNVRQMMELLEQRAMLLGPTVGRQLSEYLGMLVPRELDLLRRLGRLPPQPPALREAARAGHKFRVNFDNPMMRTLAATDAAALMQMVEMTAQVAQTTQDPTVWDYYAFNRALPNLARRRGLPADWMATKREVSQRQQQRAQQAEREARAKEMPAQAAIMKAQAITAKAQTGGNTGGTLSGTAPGGMPVIPGNPPGVPGQPGIGGRPGLVGRPGR